MSEDRLLEVLEEALAARVIEELPRTVGRYQFTHALIQETLVEELTTTRRVRLHARIAQALEELYGEQAEAHAAELAHHFAEAQTVLGPEKLVSYSLIAGEKALANYAWEEAQSHFQRGVAAKEGQAISTGRGVLQYAPTEPAKDAEAAALLFGLGRAQASTLDTYQTQEAWVNLSDAFDYYADAGDVERAVAVAEYALPTSAVRLAAAAQLAARALALVPPDSHAAGRLLSRYGRELFYTKGDYAGAQEAFGRALAIARRENDTTLEMRTLADAASVDYFDLHWQECLDKCLRAIELGRLTDDPRSEWAARHWGGCVLSFLGDSQGARQHVAACLALAEELRDRQFLWQGLWDNMMVSRLEGDWRAARDFGNRGLLASSLYPLLLGTRALLEYEVGDFDQGEVYLERLLEVTRLSEASPTVAIHQALPAVVIPLVAQITGANDRFDIAEAAAERVLSSPLSRPYFVTMARAGLALLAVQRGDATAVEQHYAALKPRQGTLLVSSLAAVDRLLGLLAQTMGQLDQAAEHFEDALAFCRRAGYRPELAWTCCDYADCLLARAQLSAHGEPVETRAAQSRPSTGSGRAESGEDRAKAMSLLDESLAISSELGMRPLMERVLSRREILTA